MQISRGGGATQYNSRTQKRKNKKALSAVVACCVASVLAVGGVLAYLTHTDYSANPMSVDTNLHISLTEPNWVEANAKNLNPMQSVAKDPTITNTGTVSEYVAASIKVPVFNGHLYNKDGQVVAVTNEDLFTYSLNTGWTQVGAPVVDAGYRTYTYVYDNVLAETAATTPVFSQVTVANFTDKLAITDTQIDVQAYGIQSLGFNNATEAYNAFVAQKAAGVAEPSPDEGGTTPDAPTGYALLRFNPGEGGVERTDVNAKSRYATEYQHPETASSKFVLPGATETQYATLSLTDDVVKEDKLQPYTREGYELAGWDITVEDNPTGVAALFEAAKDALGIEEAHAATTNTRAMISEDGTLTGDWVVDMPTGDKTVTATAIWRVDNREAIVALYGVADFASGLSNSGYTMLMDRTSTVLSSFDNKPLYKVYYGIEDSTRDFDSASLNDFSTWCGMYVKSSIKSCYTSDSLKIQPLSFGRFSSLRNFFSSCQVTNLDLSGWDVSRVTDFSQVFYGCTVLSSVSGLETWNVSSASNMYRMFGGCSALPSLDFLRAWELSNDADVSSMFSGCSSLRSVVTADLACFGAERAFKFGGMFEYCEALTVIDFSDWNVSSASVCGGMFRGCTSLTSARLSGWDISYLMDIPDGAGSVFDGCSSLSSLALLNFSVNTSGKYPVGTFVGFCEKLESVDLTGWHFVQNATNSYDTFELSQFLANTEYSQGCSVKSVNVTGWNLGSTNNLSRLFADTYLFDGFSFERIIGIATWDVSRVENFSSMFYLQKSLTNLDLSGWDVSNARNVLCMFYKCESLARLDVSGWNVSNVFDMRQVFTGCKTLTDINGVEDWNVSSSTPMTSMFDSCPAPKPSWYKG